MKKNTLVRLSQNSEAGLLISFGEPKIQKVEFPSVQVKLDTETESEGRQIAEKT